MAKKVKVKIGNLPKGYKFKNGKIVKVMATGGAPYSNSLGPIPRTFANLEAEKGETALTDLDNDGNFDLATANFFKCTPSGNFTLTLSNPAEGQSGTIMLINTGGHTVSAHASVAINADILTAISSAGTYMLTYYCSAASGNDTILVGATGALT